MFVSMKKTLAISFLAVLFAFSCFHSNSDVNAANDADLINLVANPGFEDGLEGWGGGNFGGDAHRDLDNDVYRSGQSSLGLTTYGRTQQGNNDRIAVTLTPRPSVNAGETYRFEGWVKTDLAGGSTYLRLGLRNSDNQNVGNLVRSGAVTGTNDWTYVEATFTIPDEVVALHAEIYSEAGEGTVWWDDVALYLIQ